MLPGGLISTEHAAVPSREGKGGTQNFHKHGINEKPLEKFWQCFVNYKWFCNFQNRYLRGPRSSDSQKITYKKENPGAKRLDELPTSQQLHNMGSLVSLEQSVEALFRHNHKVATWWVLIKCEKQLSHLCYVEHKIERQHIIRELFTHVFRMNHSDGNHRSMRGRCLISESRLWLTWSFAQANCRLEPLRQLNTPIVRALRRGLISLWAQNVLETQTIISLILTKCGERFQQKITYIRETGTKSLVSQ